MNAPVPELPVEEPLRSSATVRVATLDDIPFIKALAEEVYPNRNVAAAENWMRWCLQSPERLVLLGTHSFGMAHIIWHYGIEKTSGLDILASRQNPYAAFEALHMLRVMINWAKLQGAKGHFTIEADTGADFGAFAKRLGGKPVNLLQYHVPLED